VPSALRLLTTITTEGRQRERAIALWSAAGAAAGASGFVVGGVITELAGWRIVFWAYLPLAIMLAAIIVMTVPPDRDGRRSVHLNLIGAAIFTAAVMLFVLATSLVAQPGRAASGAALLAVSVAAARLFVLVDRRAPAPLFPPPLLHEQTLRHSALAGLLNTATTSSALTLTTLYLQNSRGRSALAAGMLLLPFSLAVIAGSALAPRALTRWRPQRVIAIGLTAIAVCDAALIAAAPRVWALPLCVAVGGAGIGLSSVAATGLGTSVAAAARGTASGIINTAAQLGTAVGIAVLLLVAQLTTGAPESGSPVPAIAWGFAAITSLCGATTFALRSRSAPFNRNHPTPRPPRAPSGTQPRTKLATHKSGQDL
jgi:predicted MFS family arabinose efflux permease